MLPLIFLACTRPAPAPNDWMVAPPGIIQPSPLAPYARLLTIELDRSAVLTAIASDGEHAITLATPLGTRHELPLVGLYPDATWTVEITAVDATGTRGSLEPVTFTTDPLPVPFPVVGVRALDEDAMQPGLTLTPLTSARDDVAYLAVFDEHGDVAWLYDGSGIRFLESVILPGSRVVTLHDTEILEIDWLGRVHRLLTDAPDDPTGTLMEVGGLNHELAVDDDGNLVTLSEVGTLVSDYPLSYDTPNARGDAVIAEDRAVVLDPVTGRTLASLSFLDVFDRGRLGYDSLNDLGPGLDWTHSNAATPIGDDLLLSARNQDAVARVGRDGATRWILGNHANWDASFAPLLLEPVGQPFAWMYHQHAPKWDEGRVLLFDNGNHRASPWTGEPKTDPSEAYSRVVQYTIDEDAMTVRQDWAFELDPSVFSSAMGDADWLPNGNVLATFAFVHWEGGVSNAVLGRGSPSMRLVELDPATGAVVWDLDVWAPANAAAPNWQSYRAERFPGFDLSGLVPTP